VGFCPPFLGVILFVLKGFDFFNDALGHTLSDFFDKDRGYILGELGG
jgi:hypothetical protein